MDILLVRDCQLSRMYRCRSGQDLGLRLDISRRLSRVRRDALLTRQAVPGDGLLIVKAIGVTKENAVWIIFVAEVRQCFQFSGRKAFFGHSGPYALTT